MIYDVKVLKQRFFHRGGIFDTARPLILTKIQSDDSNVSMVVDSKQPALLGEWFPITINLRSDGDISNIIISVNLLQESTSEQLSKLIDFFFEIIFFQLIFS